MTIKARHNFIYNGTFYKAGEPIEMTPNDAADYAKRGWVLSPKKTGTAPELPAGLPPLDDNRRNKKK